MIILFYGIHKLVNYLKSFNMHNKTILLEEIKPEYFS